MDDSAWAGSLTVGGVSEFFLLSPIKRGRIPGERRTYLQRVEDSFASISRRMATGLPTPLNTIPTIHFARWALLRPEHVSEDDACDPEPKFDEERRTWLLTAVVFDGQASVYSRELSASIGDQLDAIFGNCEHYPVEGAERDVEGLWAWFRRYQLQAAVFYAAYSHLSVVRIRQLEAFKARFDAFVAKVRPNGASIGDMNFAFDEFLRETRHYASGFPASGGTFKGLGSDDEP